MIGSALYLGVGFGNPASPGWGLGWVCLGTVCGVAPLLPAGACGVCGWPEDLACIPPFLVRVLGRAWLCSRSACSLPFPVLVCGVGVRAGVWVSAAPRHSLRRCWGVCLLVCLSCVVSCTSWLGVLCRGVWLGQGRCRAPPSLAGALGRVCVCVCAPFVPCLFWLGCAVWACVLGSGFGCALRFMVGLLGCVCGRACAPLAPALSGGPTATRGCAGVAVFCSSFVWGGMSVLGFVLSVAGCPGLGSRGLCPPIPSPLRCVVFCFFFVPAWCVSACFGCPFPWCAAAPGLVLPVLAGWSPCAALGGAVFSAVWVGGLAASCGVGGPFDGCGMFSRPLPCFFLCGGGVCLFLPLPSLRWRTHWLAFSVVFRVAIGGCVLPGRAPAPWVEWVIYTLGSAPPPAGLGSGSAGWAAAPGGFVWPLVRGAGVFRGLSPRRGRFQFSGGGLCGSTATVVVGRAVAACRCLTGWWGSFRGVRWLVFVRPSVSVPCCGVVVCCSAPCCAVPRRGVPLFAALCRVVLWRVVPKALLPKGKGRDVYPRVQVNGLGCVCCVRAVCKCVVA